ncbi:MAG: TPM domain-containing protein [Alphaproteobacteria bacterium]
MVTAKVPLTHEERERIRLAVADAERRTSAHFALVIVPASERYALFPVVWAALGALSATGVLALLRPTLTIGEGFLVNAALFIVLALVLDWWPVRLRIVPSAIKREHARQLAHREFATRIVGSAEHRNGVLFFVSLGERYVEVLADRAIHDRVAPDTWEELVTRFVAAVKADRLADGFIAAVEACAATLEKHYPRRDR